MRLAAGTAAVVLASCALATSASAATYTVTRDDDPPPGPCTPADCSLREAVRAANATAEDDQIELGSKRYVITREGVDDDARAGDFDVLKPGGEIEITGTGRSFLGQRPTTTIFTSAPDRLFHIVNGSLTLKRLNVNNGFTTANGAGVLSDGGSVKLTAVGFDRNRADNGGGIYLKNDADLVATRTVFEENRGRSRTEGGGAIHAAGESRAVIRDSRFTRNFAGRFGGAIHAGDSSSVEVVNTNMRWNKRAERGGAVYAGDKASVSLTRATLHENRALAGGGIYGAGDSTVRVENSTLSENSARTGGQIAAGDTTLFKLSYVSLAYDGTIFEDIVDESEPGTPRDPRFIFRATVVQGQTSGCSFPNPESIVSKGFNVEDKNSCRFTADTDQTNAQTGLGPFGSNDQRFLPLAAASDAVDAVTSGFCPATDVRGVRRPQGDACDAGSYELKR